MRETGGLLKFITCGSVDDGKSTLIGHILYDAKLLYADQARALELDSRVGSRGGKIDYSLLLDGLIAEREQGITIDVAYRYFTTDRRSFIVADTPGHEEYTRNMAVGASFAQLAVILVDASRGVLEQTRRHARICALMGIRHFVFAVNKMDLVGFEERRFAEIEAQIGALARALGLGAVKSIPLSATEGDNLTRPSERMPWYRGGTLLNHLETVDADGGADEEGFVLPVQRVCRPDHTFRGFQGQIESGRVAVGDELTLLPSGERAGVRTLLVGDRAVSEAFQGQPVTVQLDREADVSRGCVLVRGARPAVTRAFEATILWMDDEPLSRDRDFFVKTGTKLIPGRLEAILYRVDINTGEHLPADSVSKNALARCEFSLAQPVVLDTFERHRTLGELILIDRVTNATSACGVIERLKDAGQAQAEAVNASVRACQKDQTPYVVLVPDLDRAKRLEIELVLFHGRHTLWVDEPDPDRLLYAAKLLQRAGLIAILAAGTLDADGRRRLEAALLPGTLLDLIERPELEERLMAL